MANEIARQLYLFAKLSTNTGESKGPDYYIRRQMDKEKNPGADDTPEGFYYNYIHDLESVWWIAVWALFNFEKKDIGANKFDSWAAGQRKLNKRKLFSGTFNNMDRFEFLRIRGTYTKTTKYLPKYFKNLPTTLGIIAQAVTEHYQLKESNKEWNEEGPILWDESFNIHKVFIYLLRRVDMKEFEMARIPGIDVIINHTPRIIDGIPPDTQSNKRRTDEQDSEQCNKRQRYCIYYFSHSVMTLF